MHRLRQALLVSAAVAAPLFLTGTQAPPEDDSFRVPPTAADTANRNPPTDSSENISQGAFSILQSQPAPVQTATVFSLKHFDATDAGKILQTVYKDADVNVTVDERVNAIIAVGPPAQVEEVGALLKRLDAGADGDRAPVRVQRIGPRRHAVPDHEPQIAHITQEIRELDAAERNVPRERIDELRQRLHEEVAAAFERRQQAQRAEVEALRNRLEQIERRIAGRDRLADEIIARRVEELINPELRWEPAETHGSPIGGPGPARIPAVDATATLSPFANTARMPRKPSADAAPLGDMRSLLSDSSPNLPRLESVRAVAAQKLERLERLHEKGIVSSGDIEEARGGLAAAEADLQAARRRADAVSKLLEIELRKAQLQLEAHSAALKRLEALGNAVSGSEIEQKRVDLQNAELEVQRVQTLIELHRAGQPGDPDRPEREE